MQSSVSLYNGIGVCIQLFKKYNTQILSSKLQNNYERQNKYNDLLNYFLK